MDVQTLVEDYPKEPLDLAVKPTQRSEARSVTKSISCAIGLATLCMLVLATHVSPRFERVRHRIITSPRAADAPTITVPLQHAVESSPAAIVLRLRGAAQPTTLTVKLDDDDVAVVRVPADREIRVDATTNSRSRPGSRLVLAADRPGWWLLSLEVANVHGFSSGLFSVDVVPRGQTHVPVPAALIGLIGVALIAVRGIAAPAIAPAARQWYRAVGAIVVLLFVAVLAADRVTQFKVLLTPRTFGFCVALLYADVIVGTTLRALSRLRRATPRNAASVVPKAGLQSARAAAAVLAGTVGVLALTRGSHIAGAADPYGYISQSAMWAEGHLTISQPVMDELPVDLDERALAPLAYMPHAASGVRGQLVPVCAPGLPLLMAALRRLGGANAYRFAVPLLAALGVWLTFLLGRRVYGAATGLFAAAWLSCSPSFVDSMWSPMSDVPATAWWLGAFVAALRPGLRRAVSAGLAVSLGVLTRPNLLPLAIIIAAPWVWRCWSSRTDQRGAAAQFALFSAVAVIGPISVAALFTYWYGSPFRSGYGELDAIYSWRYILPNFARYSGWLIQTQSPLVVAAAFAPVVARWRISGSVPQPRQTVTWLMLAFSGLVWASYLVYVPWQSWGFLRFMLPSYPFIITLASAVLVAAASRTRAPLIIGGGLLAFVCWHGADFLVDRRIADEKAKDVRYQRLAEFVGQTLPSRAILFSGLHSGSLRYYAGRTTLRWQFVAGDALDDMVATLERRGFYPYVVLEHGEEQEFREHFERHSELGALDWPPMSVASGFPSVSIWNPRDRPHGSTISPIPIH